MSEVIDVVVAGHISLDVTPQMFSGGQSIGEIFRPGKLINVGPATVSAGGPVSNAGLALHRLGIDVKLMSKCGDDMFGRDLIQRIKTEAPGAETGIRIVKGQHTSYTIVVCPPGTDRIFLHCPGANDTFDSQDVDLAAVGRARLFHFGYPPLMARTFANGGRELVKIFSEAKAAGATTSLDMSLPDPAAPGGQVDWTAILNRTLPHVDIFVPSAEELTFMLRRATFDRLVASGDLLGLIDAALLSDLADRCIDAGAGIVLIKCGYLGIYIRTAGLGRLENIGLAKPHKPRNWASRELFEPTYAVGNVVSATGSGDSAIAGFLAAYLRGCDVADCLRYACAAGAQNVQAHDSLSGVKSWEETTRQVRSGMAKNEVPIDMPGWRHDDAANHYRGPRDGKP